ncbi:hypothetical protein VPH35_061313 [Triticum aestivum]|uniref:Uncharacterized protein n=2 Tax=Aegilops tauschii subsp. strangulata TaxID=200361 RepID=A0A453FSU5_AEGTS
MQATIRVRCRIGTMHATKWLQVHAKKKVASSKRTAVTGLTVFFFLGKKTERLPGEINKSINHCPAGRPVNLATRAGIFPRATSCLFSKMSHGVACLDITRRLSATATKQANMPAM